MIPKMSPCKFLQENWRPDGPTRFNTTLDVLIESLIGWCEADRIYFRPKDKKEFCIAVMFSDNTWCHCSFEWFFSSLGDYNYVDIFDFEGFDKTQLEEYKKYSYM